MTELNPSSEFDFSSALRPGDHVMWPQGTGEPTGLTVRLLGQAGALPRVTIVTGMVVSESLRSFPHGVFDLLCLNGAGQARLLSANSGNRIIPAHLSAIPGLISDRQIPVDVALVRVRPTEDPDVFCLGVMVDYVHEMVAAARVVVAELDERMPLTHGETRLRRSQIDFMTLADGPEVLIADPAPSQQEVTVARRVADLIPDKATLQLGVGGLPAAVCSALGDHRGLGLHSGVFPDAVVGLIRCGAIDNLHKGVDAGISVAGGLFGGRGLMELAHDNPKIELRRAAYTHQAGSLARIERLHCINSAIEIDLSGQVNSEIAGGRYVGAVGGQVDFVRGARLSRGGRSIIAMGAATPDGRYSKIVADLGGRPVTTARSDMDIVVTEYGHASLWGLDLHRRAEALIAIAHPAFRDGLQTDFEASLRTAKS